MRSAAWCRPGPLPVKPPGHRWPWALAWIVLLVVIYAGVTVLVDVLHPQGKQDPRAIPVAVFALVSGLGGSALILWMQRRR